MAGPELDRETLRGRQCLTAEDSGFLGMIEDVTPEWQQRANQQPSITRTLAALAEARPRALPCSPTLPCWLQPWCCRTETTYQDPSIQGRHYPVRIQKVTFRPFKGRMDGDVQVGFRNDSTEGSKTTNKVCRCGGGSESSSTERVAGSADVGVTGQHVHKWLDMQAVAMDAFKDTYSRVKPAAAVSSVASFQRSGIKDILVAASDLITSWWRTGTTRMRVGVTITSAWTWNWLGKTNQKTLKFTFPDTPLPVDEINVDWSLW